MMRLRRAFVSAAAVTAALAAGAPAAGAITFPTLPFSIPVGLTPFAGMPLSGGASAGAGGVSSVAGACGRATGQEAQGTTAGTTVQNCSGAGLNFVGPAIGQIATVIGPTIIGPAVVGSVAVSAGNASAGG